MTKEQEYLISLLAAYISGEKIILQPDTDYRLLFNTAKIHNLACPVFCAISGAENTNEINENLKKDISMGEDVMVQGTPTVFVNGEKDSSRQKYETLGKN